MNDLPKGFYTGPDGRERFWDGNEWFDSNREPSVEEPKQSAIKKFQGLTKRNKIIIFSATALVLVAVGISSVVAVQNHNAEVAAEQLAIEQEQKREAAAVAAEEADLQSRRDNRKRVVSEIEASVRTMAEQHVADGIVDGPIISVECTTTGGISIEDISIRSMLFECFAANTDNGDGTLRGVYYHARANWDDGTWTYGLGRE